MKKKKKSDKSDTIKKRIAEKQKLFLQLYKGKACNISMTCKAIGINRDTYYEWRKKYKTFDRDCHNEEEALIDDAESQLQINIRNGKETSLIFFLCNKAKHRGWQNKHMIQGDPDKPIQVIVQKGVDLSKYPAPKPEPGKNK